MRRGMNQPARDLATLLDLLSRTGMARERKSLGKVEERRGVGVAGEGRFRINLGSHHTGRFVYSAFGQPLASRELAEAVLALIEAQAARGRSVEDVVAEISPDGGADAAIEPLFSEWVEAFRRKVEVERRQPRTLREYERWAGRGGHFDFWRGGKMLGDVDAHAVEEWDYALATVRKLAPKTRRNVLSGFRVFLTWAAEQRPGFAVPKIPWPEVEEHQPTILAPEIQEKVLAAIPWPKAGIFWCMTTTLVRPSEARALRVRDWVGAEIRVSRAAKDDHVRGLVRGLKSRNVKTVPLLIPLDLWLLEFVTAERRLQDPDGPLFKNPDGSEGGWWSKTSLRRTWAAACAKVGVSASLYEGTKHSSATALKAAGLDDRVLAALAGHKDPRSITKYARLHPAAILSALGRLHEREKP